jgi:hypothetical protein
MLDHEKTKVQEAIDIEGAEYWVLSRMTKKGDHVQVNRWEKEDGEIPEIIDMQVIMSQLSYRTSRFFTFMAYGPKGAKRLKAVEITVCDSGEDVASLGESITKQSEAFVRAFEVVTDNLNTQYAQTNKTLEIARDTAFGVVDRVNALLDRQIRGETENLEATLKNELNHVCEVNKLEMALVLKDLESKNQGGFKDLLLECFRDPGKLTALVQTAVQIYLEGKELVTGQITGSTT